MTSVLQTRYMEELTVLRDFLESDLIRTLKDEASANRVISKLKAEANDEGENIFEALVSSLSDLEGRHLEAYNRLNTLENNQRIILTALKSMNSEPRLSPQAESDLITVCSNQAIY